MVTDVWVYLEGHKSLRPGFSALFKRAIGEQGDSPVRIRPVPGGAQAIKYFMNALRTKPDALNLLLRDCEGLDGSCSLESLRSRSDWKPPKGIKINDSQVFWMVEIMESWFIADRDALSAYYGAKFQAAKLPRNPKVEEIPKRDVLSGLKTASKRTQKGPYHKTRHAPDLLRQVDPSKIEKVAPAARRLFDGLRDATAI